MELLDAFYVFCSRGDEIRPLLFFPALQTYISVELIRLIG